MYFCDGDFWHGHNWAIRGYGSLENELRRYSKTWADKISRNIQRDERINKELESLGWRVLRIWESDIKADVKRCGDRVEYAYWNIYPQFFTRRGGFLRKMYESIVSLFAGIGGICLGFSTSWFRCHMGKRKDHAACLTYIAITLEMIILWKEIFERFQKKSIPHADVLAAGFPCQSFSTAGAGRGFADPRGTLFLRLSEWLKRSSRE